MSDPLPLGIHFGIPDEVYRADPGAAQSDLKLMAISPAHCKARLDDLDEDGDTEARVFGRAFHTRLLQPDLYDKQFIEKPAEYDGRKAEWKSWKKEVAGDREPISADDARRIRGMRDRLLSHATFKAAYESHDPEVSIVQEFNVAGTPVRVKGRLDLVPREGRTIVDLKKTQVGKAHVTQWGKQVGNWGYYIQSPYYIDLFNAATGSERDLFIHFAVEDRYPYEIGCYILDEEAMSFGRTKYQNLLLRYAECQASGVWPGYSETPIKISLPTWAKTL